MDDVGLWKFDGQHVEVRFNKHDMSKAYALVGGSIRPLKAVTSLTMLDDEAMTEAIATKRRQMKAVREAFALLTKPIGGLTLKSETTMKIKMADKVQNLLPESTDIDLPQEVAKQVAKANRKPTPIKAVHTSPRDHYRWCMDMIISGSDLPLADQNFMQTYEKTDEYKESCLYWNNYRKLGGIR
jgi:hypothetical protein